MFYIFKRTSMIVILLSKKIQEYMYVYRKNSYQKFDQKNKKRPDTTTVTVHLNRIEVFKYTNLNISNGFYF